MNASLDQMSRWIFVLAGLLLQPATESPRNLAQAPRPLTTAEIQVVFRASRLAIAGKTLRLAFPGFETGPEVLMAADGRPQITRLTYGITGGTVSGGTGGDPARSEWHEDFVDVVERSGEPATRCDGSSISGELVITYRRRASTGQWTAAAATTALTFDGMPGPEVGAPIFDLLAAVTPASSAELRVISGHRARAFVAPFARPSGSVRGSYGLDNPPV